MADLDTYAGASVLVTGASGFIGSHLTARLVQAGATVHAVTSTVSSLYPVRLLELRGDITLHEANLCDRSALDRLVGRARPDIVFHLGAYTHVGKSWDRLDEGLQTNVQGTANLLQALDLGGGYRRFVNIGTSEIYGRIGVPFREDAEAQPASPYAISKYAAERYCRAFAEAYERPVVLIRPFNAYGPAQTPDRVVPEIIIRGLQRQPLLMTLGNQTREFNYVDDLADGLLLAGVVPGLEGELINLGAGEEVRIRDLASLILAELGNPIEPQFGALPERLNEIERMYCDNQRAEQLLGWRAKTSMETGLRTTIEWYRSELAKPQSPFVL